MGRVSVARRGLLGAVVAAPAALVAATAAGTDRGPLRARWEAAANLACAIDADHSLTDDETDLLVDRLTALEDVVLAAPITCVDDAVAKLECCAIMSERGPRADWSDCRAVAEVAEYLRRALA